MGERYNAALTRFMQDCGDPQDAAEREQLEVLFAGTIKGAACRYEDAKDEFIEILKSTRLGRFMLWLLDLIS